MSRDITRRRMIKGAGAASAAGLAGCLGSGGSGNGGGGGNENDGGSGNGGGGGNGNWKPIDAQKVPPQDVGNAVNVWNWYSEWVDSTIPSFTSKEEYSNVKVNVSDYSSAGEWLSRLEAGNGEIDQVPTSMSEMSGNFDLWEPLPVQKMKSWQRTDQNAKDVINSYYKKGGDVYGVPYSRGINPALNYNTNEFSEAPTSWGVMWDESYKNELAVMDSYSYATAMAACYTKQNPFDPDDYDEIREALIQQKPLNTTYWSDYSQGMNMMANEEIVATGNVAARAYRARFELGGPVDYTVPKEGAPVGTYPYTIPKNAPHPKASLAFFEYMIGNPRQRVKGFTKTGFKPPMKNFDKWASQAGVSKEEIKYNDYEAKTHPDGTWYAAAEESKEVRKRLSELWTKVKSA